MTTPRAGHVTEALADGRVLLAGGSPGSYTTSLASAEVFDPVTGRFQSVGSMTSDRRFAASARITRGPHAGKILICGGVGTAGVLTTAELFDPASGTFSSVGQMSTARYLHQAIVLEAGAHAGKVLVLGGSSIYGPGMAGRRDAELFDPATGTFSSLGGMRTERHSFSVTTLEGGRVLVAGGKDANNVPTAAAELFDPATSIFTATGSMLSARCQQGAVRLDDGTVLLAGGTSDSAILGTAERFDPANGTFRAAGTLLEPRTSATLVTPSAGKALLAGGTGDAKLTLIRDSAERFDVVSGAWSAAGRMQAGRYNTRAVVIAAGPKAGKVFIAGGWTQSGVATATADLY